MERRVVDDFIEYAKEQFGYDVVLKIDEEHDSFESIFGTSFLNQNISLETLAESYGKLEYVNDSTNVQLEIVGMNDTTSLYNMVLAA